MTDIWLCPVKTNNDVWLCPIGPHAPPVPPTPGSESPPAPGRRGLNEWIGSEGGYLTRPQFDLKSEEEIVAFLITLLEE